MAQAFYGTGKRKSSIARVWLKPGKGAVTVNDKEINDYFGRETCRMIAMQPLELIGVSQKYDVFVNVSGGGITGQAGAIRHGITKALMELNPEFREALKKAGYVTRDSRAKERKKYGRKSARARFQYSKR